MRKILALLLKFILALSTLTSCGNTPPESAINLRKIVVEVTYEEKVVEVIVERSCPKDEAEFREMFEKYYQTLVRFENSLTSDTNTDKLSENITLKVYWATENEEQVRAAAEALKPSSISYHRKYNGNTYYAIDIPAQDVDLDAIVAFTANENLIQIFIGGNFSTRDIIDH